jgi:tetratricopeptide (TPR) repeat protein
VGVAEEQLGEAQRVLNDLVVEENRSHAAFFLSQACMGRNVDELRQAIGRAKEARVDEQHIEAAVARLDELLAEIARREAASKKLREIVSRQPGPQESLESILDALNVALQDAHTSGVASSEREAGAEKLQVLMTQKRREDAKKAMEEALNTHDVMWIQAAIFEAKDAGVDAMEITMTERALQDLEEEIELANNKEKLLKRRIEHAMDAKNEAEMAETSLEVEKMLGEHGVIHALREAIKEAKNTRMVRRGEIQKAEAVLPEVTADLKRILADKQANERKLAGERLRGDMEIAKRDKPTTRLVLATLREAIDAAQVFRADTKDAEALMKTLVAEHEQAMQEAQDQLDRGLNSKDPQIIRDGLAGCKVMLLTDAISRAMSQIRGIITQDIAVASELENKEERLAMVARMELLMGLLRENGDNQLRQLHNSLQDLKGALRVFCRIRPMNGKEKKRNDTISAELHDPFTVSVKRAERASQSEVYTYDAVFGTTSTQAEVFHECRSLVQSAFDGYNVTIFTYGQTGAGKTWTLYGSGQEPGISPRTCEVIFATVAKMSDQCQIDMKASMIELYCSELKDLLNAANDAPPVIIRNYRQPDGTQLVRLEGVTEIGVRSSEDLAQVVARGLGSRKTRATQMNADSSRSHLLLIIDITIRDRESQRTRHGKITIVDLAGSERLAKSGATGDAAKEAIEINKSLTALGDVMMAFTSKAKLIPYRNHKLTQIMQDSLGGTAKTLMFVNVSPSSGNVEETVQSLKYASRARCIENDVHMNVSKATTPAGRGTPQRTRNTTA